MQITNYITLLNSFKLMSVNLDRTSTGSLFQRVAALYWKVCLPAVIMVMFHSGTINVSLDGGATVPQSFRNLNIWGIFMQKV